MKRIAELSPENNVALSISIGRNRFDEDWQRIDTTWHDLVAKLAGFRMQPYTVDDYYSWVTPEGKTSPRMENAKDVGGWVGGELSCGNRTVDTLRNRCVITLDADHADAKFIDRVALNKLFDGLTYLIHSTHSHTSDAPRYRIVIPLDRAVTPDEYRAIAKMIATDIGLQYFDDVGERPAQLMYWPTAMRDVEPVFIAENGLPGIADTFLMFASEESKDDQKKYVPKTDDELRAITGGGRNKLLMSEGGHWFRTSPDFDRANPSKEAIEAYVEQVNSKFGAPLDDREVQSCARKLFKYAQKDAEKIRTGEIQLFIRQHALTDFGMAERFVDKFGKRAKYVPAHAAWSMYEGGRWKLLGKNVKKQANNLVVGMLRDLGSEFSDEPVDPNAEESETWRDIAEKYARQAESATKLGGIYRLCSEQSAADLSEFDNNTDLLNFVNGTYEISTGRLRPHSPEDMLTRMMAVEYDPEAKCPRFMQFLEETFSDPETRAYVQRVFGYSLTPLTHEHVFFLHYGVGRNGKSVLMNTISNIMGTEKKAGYAHAANIQTFCETTKSASGSAPSPDIYAMKAKHLVFAEEGQVSSVINDGLIKKMAAGGIMECRTLNSEPDPYKFTGKVHIIANHKPAIRDTSVGMWERACLIPYNNIVPRERRDKYLEEQLMREAPGIVNWLIEGMQNALQYGLGMCSEVEDASAEYKADCDELGDFFFECVDTDDSEVTESTMAVFEAYYDYCTKCRMTYILDLKKFSKRMKDRGFRVVQSGPQRKNHYKGLKLKSE